MDAHLGGHTAPSQVGGDSDLLPSRCQTWLSRVVAPRQGEAPCNWPRGGRNEDDTLPGSWNCGAREFRAYMLILW